MGEYVTMDSRSCIGTFRREIRGGKTWHVAFNNPTNPLEPDLQLNGVD